MLWSPQKQYLSEPYDTEAELEKSIQELKDDLFGSRRIYLEVKKKIGKQGKTRNIPDAYLIDLTSKKEPMLYVVENELAKHDPLKHIAVQILEFSLSFETTPLKVKTIIKDVLRKDKAATQLCSEYATDNGFENIDYLLERIIYRKDSFNALVIIDELPDELETILLSRFKFPVEIITLQRFKTNEGERLYQFEPFLADLTESSYTDNSGKRTTTTTIDPSEIDTIVVPAREEGFQETFIGENCWYAIRIHGSMINKIKHIAAYQVSPISAITHIATVKKIEQYKDSNKYILHFSEPAKEIDQIKLIPKGKIKAPQAPRYTSMKRLQEAKNLDDVF